IDVGQRLLQIDDVDAVAVGEDEPLHLRVPATGLVPEMRAAVEQLLHGYDSHCSRISLSLPGVAASRRPAALAPQNTRTRSGIGTSRDVPCSGIAPPAVRSRGARGGQRRDEQARWCAKSAGATQKPANTDRSASLRRALRESEIGRSHGYVRRAA